MKKSIFILLVAVLCAPGIYAQRLSVDVAQQKAEAFFQSKGMKRELVPYANVRKAKSVVDNELMPAYYVFNCSDNEGYVIVAADESRQPILAYSATGTIAQGKMPVQLQKLLGDYERVAQMKKSSAAYSASGKSRIEPLISSQWDQDRAPYNSYCPTVDGVKSAAGCVSVAMAQIMNYHKWPSETKSAIPARDRYGLSEVPAGTKIDWDNMLDVYGASYTEAQAAAVGRLMLYCGQSLPSTVYHAGTGATMYEVEGALRDIFGYDDDVQHVKRSSYTIAQWSDLIYDELKAGRPVVMAGVTSDVSGHAFVCDGYDGEGFFHINWGWSGSNGYYSIELLSPSLEEGYEHLYDGMAYSYEREAIIGIHLPDGVAAVRKNDRRLTTANIIIDGSALYPEMLTGSVTESFDFDYGFGIIAGDGTIAPVVTKSKKDMFYGNSAAIREDLKFDLTGKFTAAGVYKVIPISKIMGTATWFRNTPGNIYVEVTVDGSKKITLMQLKEEEVSLEVTEMKLLGSLIEYTSHAVEATVKNNGGEFFGELYMVVEGEKIRTAVSLVEGGSGKFYFPVGQPYSGSYTAKIYSDEDCRNEIGSLSYSIKSLINSAANLEISHDLGAVVEGTAATFNMTIKNNGSKYLNAIELRIEGGGHTIDVQNFYVEIESGATAVLPVKLSNLFENVTHYATIKYYSNDVAVTALEFSFICTPEDGETGVTGVDDAAVDAVYYDLSGRSVGNPVKGIYIVNGKKVLIK